MAQATQSDHNNTPLLAKGSSSHNSECCCLLKTALAFISHNNHLQHLRQTYRGKGERHGRESFKHEIGTPKPTGTSPASWFWVSSILPMRARVYKRIRAAIARLHHIATTEPGAKSRIPSSPTVGRGTLRIRVDTRRVAMATNAIATLASFPSRMPAISGRLLPDGSEANGPTELPLQYTT